MRDDSERETPGSLEDRDVILPTPRTRPDAGGAHPNASAERGDLGLFDRAPAQGTTRKSRTAALGDLRTRITALVEAVHDMPEPSLELDEAQWRIDELAQEINRPYPSAPRVRSRWLRLAPLLRELDSSLPVAATGRLIDDAF